MYTRPPRFVLVLLGCLILLSGCVGLSLELINRLLLQHRPELSLVIFLGALALVFALGFVACRAFGLNRWIVLPLTVLFSALLLLLLLFLTHCCILSDGIF